MNNFLNKYFGFYFELNIELNHFLARFNEKMNIQNVSARARWGGSSQFLQPTCLPKIGGDPIWEDHEHGGARGDDKEDQDEDRYVTDGRIVMIVIVVYIMES